MVFSNDVIHLVVDVFLELAGVWHIVLPKRSRWLVKPELLLDHCVRLTRAVRRR